MRKPLDRIRHAMLFELIALVIVAPFGGMIFGVEPLHLGVVAVASTTVAMVWTYGYNLLFDKALLRWRGSVQKTLPIRVLHTILFEGGLVALFAPLIALYLDITLWQAVTLDLSMAVFYALFAFAYNWGYDLVFPIKG